MFGYGILGTIRNHLGNRVACEEGVMARPS